VHDLYFHGYWVLKKNSSELPVNVVDLCYLFKCGMWDRDNCILKSEDEINSKYSVPVSNQQ
jgi:hypothetical protein